MKKSTQGGVTEIFFNASSAAALQIYKKSGKIPMSLSALVKEGKDYNLIPIGDDVLPSIDPSLAQVAIDLMLKPLVSYTGMKEHKKAHPVVFFLSVAAQGGLRDIDNGDVEVSHIIITAARTEDKMGRTNTFKVEKDGFTKLTAPEDDAWVEQPREEDVPASLAQGLLDMLWKSYIVSKNMSLLNNTKA